MSSENGKNAALWYGCLFCTTGREIETARKVEMRWDGVKARAASVVKRKSCQGVKRLEKEVILPSYVFFQARDGFEPEFPLPDGVWRMLKTVDGDCRLTGKDEWFARWLLDQDGEIGLSKAYQEGSWIQIEKGPLKDLEGYICRIDRRNRSGQVKLQINGREVKVWLGFELLEKDGGLFETEGRTD